MARAEKGAAIDPIAAYRRSGYRAKVGRGASGGRRRRRRHRMTDFERTRALFALPEGVIYLDGNSLGPLPMAAVEAVNRTMVEEWGSELIRAWNSRGWARKPRELGDRIGRLIGAPPGSVVVGDTLSIKVFQALAAALALRPDRRVILSDNGNFPTDLYMAQGLTGVLGPRPRTPHSPTRRRSRPPSTSASPW